MNPSNLSVQQTAQMMRLAEVEHEESPFGLGRHSGRAASAWHRTVTSLVKKGLVLRVRFGDHYAAKLTPAGRNWLHQRGAL